MQRRQYDEGPQDRLLSWGSVQDGRSCKQNNTKYSFGKTDVICVHDNSRVNLALARVFFQQRLDFDAQFVLAEREDGT